MSKSRILVMLILLSAPARAQTRLDSSLADSLASLGARRVGAMVTEWRDSAVVRTISLSARGFASADSSLLLRHLKAAFGPQANSTLPRHWWEVEVKPLRLTEDSAEFDWSESILTRCANGLEWGEHVFAVLHYIRGPSGFWEGPQRIRGTSPFPQRCPDHSSPG